MAFNNWPYTNFQDLNLGWIIATCKSALNKALESLGKANAVEAEVGTYSERISNAEAEADSARNIANTARSEALNAQSDATSAIAIGQAAQGTANTALSNSSNAVSLANDAADAADVAVDSATDATRDAEVALQLANLANEDYLNVGITVFPSDSPQADKNADQILAAVTANKKIKFTVDDARNGETYTTYNYTIDPVDNTASDIDIKVCFDTSASSNSLKFLLVTFTKRIGTGGLTAYSTISSDVTFSGGDSQLTSTLLNLLIPILRQGLYGTDQEAAILALETALGGTPPVQTCVITNNLTNVTNSNEATAVNSGSAYTATLTPDSGTVMQNVTITMGGVDVTASVYSNGTISIHSITGDIVITAVAESIIETYTPTLTAGYIVANGSVNDSTSYQYTSVIPCRAGDKIYGTCENSSYPGLVVHYIRSRFTAAYDNNGNVISSAGSDTQADFSESSPFVVPSGVYGVVFSIVNTLANNVVVYVDKSERTGA